MSEDDPRLHPQADVLETVLATRPERVTDLVFAGLEPEVRGALRGASEILARAALSEEPVAPSPSLRARIVDSVAKRRARPVRRALLVIDMLNDHLQPGKPLEVPRARDVVPALAARLDAARADGTPVIYVCDRHASTDDRDYDQWPIHNLEGTDGAEVWPAIAPKAGDRMVTKPAISGFVNSKLEALLEELRVETVVITGCATEVQLMATATDALQRGFAVEMPHDTQAGASAVGEAVVMGTLAALAPYGPARVARLDRIALATSA